MANEFTTTPGRLVQGSLYRGKTQDRNGQPLVYKSGDQKGQPRTEYYFAVAIPKNPGEQHWNQTEWGAVIYNQGQAAWPAGQAQSPSFSWKVEDGDDTTPDKKGRANVSREGFPGCWIVKFSGSYPVTVYNNDGSQQIVEPDAVQAGDYIQVFGNVQGNNTQDNPGVYLNYIGVAFTGYGPRITYTADGTQMGFGKAPVPAGVQSAPTGNLNATTAATAAQATAPAAAPVPAPTPAPAPVPTPAAPPPAPEVLAQPTAPVMTAKANGQPYEAFTAAGWTDEQLKANGYME